MKNFREESHERQDEAGARPGSTDERLAELLDLAADQCHDTISDEGTARLETLLADRDLRATYVDYMLLHGELCCGEWGLDGDSREGEYRLKPGLQRGAGPTRTPWVLFSALAIAASLLLAVYLFALRDRPVAYVPTPVPPAVVENGETSHYFDHAAEPPAAVAELHDRDAPPPAGETAAAGKALQPGTLRTEKAEIDLQFKGGAQVQLDAATVFGLDSPDRATLFSGAISARKTKTDTPFVVDTPGVRVGDRGAEFTVLVNEVGQTEVKVLNGEVETQTRLRLPRFYWNFDEEYGPVVDRVSQQHGRQGAGATRTEGLIGKGAMRFDNTPRAYIDVGNGGGVEVGTGAFAMSQGVSIEALVLPQWSGKGFSDGVVVYDYDEIFRKEDGVYRILLCFQNDHGKFAEQTPEVQRGPCLSFGLHLAGIGYNELDLVLDGKEGRPTLAELTDGKPHHIVATYDSWSGAKSIYIDGLLRMRHEFPKGTLVISGGSSPAIIGNICVPNCEPFTGVIDEVALYDFALASEEIERHHSNVESGKDYFGLSDETLRSQTGGWQAGQRIKAGETMRFEALTSAEL